MKEVFLDKSLDISQLNISGMRVIILFVMLLDAHRSIEEIKYEYLKNPLIQDDVSEDTIRNDINALRDAGCEISKATKLQNKYALISHPFHFFVKAESIRALKKMYSKVYTNLSFHELIAIDAFFVKISNYIRSEKLKNQLLSISKVARVDKEILKDLLKYSNGNYKIIFNYKNAFGKIFKKEVIAKKLEFRHDKLYLYSCDIDTSEIRFYKVENIVEILSVHIKKERLGLEPIRVIYKLLNMDKQNYTLSKNENLLYIDGKDLVIEAIAENEFIMMQNILNFGSRCVVLEPFEFREKIISVIKSIREVYYEKGQK